ncbi:inovirus-type Gp2 protein [Halopseudomonas pelagia]
MKISKRYKRLKANPSLHLHYENQFDGFEVYTDRGPLIREFLDQLYDTTERALDQYSRVFAARFDLRFPQIDPFFCRDYDSNKFISTFFETLKRLIKRDRELAGLERRVHQTDVRYVWAREVGRSGKPHYLNRPQYSRHSPDSGNDAFRTRPVTGHHSCRAGALGYKTSQCN